MSDRIAREEVGPVRLADVPAPGKCRHADDPLDRMGIAAVLAERLRLEEVVGDVGRECSRE